MRAFKRQVPAARTNLLDLVGDVTPQVSRILLQSPEANVDIIYIGDKSEQPFELRPKANAQIEVNNAKGVYIRGNPADEISIGLL